MHKCPKQENRSWETDDVCDIQCPGCGQTVEFFKEEEKRKCRKCGQVITNPKHQKT